MLGQNRNLPNTMKAKIRLFVFEVIFAIADSGCGKEDIEVYTVILHPPG